MPLLDHLRELRNRVLLAAAGVLVGAVAGWFLYDRLFSALQQPILDLAAQRGSTVLINFSGVAKSLDVQLKVALFAGAILSSPWWIYQLWAFIAPGLTRKERRYTLAFVATGVPLFLAGHGRRVVDPAEGGGDPHELHARRGEQHHRRADLPRLRDADGARLRGRVPAPGGHGRPDAGGAGAGQDVAGRLALGRDGLGPVRRDGHPDRRRPVDVHPDGPDGGALLRGGRRRDARGSQA